MGLKLVDNGGERSTIVVIYRDGKDLLNTSSYKPISLLNSDINILVKILATRQNEIIQKLVHPDQMGFKPGRFTNTNIRRVYLNLQVPTDEDGARATLSLDAAKAFDSLEWQYIWRVLAEFQFGPIFINWVKMLYKTSEAKVKVNKEFSDKFCLRATRQGCPLSPFLFVPAIKPLAIAFRSSPKVRKFRREGVEEKVALYADDLLLFLGDTQNSLVKAMDIIKKCCQFSGLTINWEKSVLLPLGPLESKVPSLRRLPRSK